MENPGREQHRRLLNSLYDGGFLTCMGRKRRSKKRKVFQVERRIRETGEPDSRSKKGVFRMSARTGAEEAESGDSGSGQDVWTQLFEIVDSDRFTFGGNCPVQGEFYLKTGEYGYFRARGSHASLEICTADTERREDDIWWHGEKITDDRFGAGWIDRDEAAALLLKWLKLYVDRTNN